MRIFHAYAARFNALDPPRARAQQKHVAGQAFHREIFVHGPNHFAVRFSNHRIIRGVGDGAAGGDGSQPRATPASHSPVHLIAMQVRATAAALRGDAFGKHLDDSVEVFAIEIAIGISAPYQRVEVFFLPIAGCRLGNDLLCQYVEWCLWNFEFVQLARTNGAHQRRAFDQFIARGGKETALRLCAHPVP